MNSFISNTLNSPSIDDADNIKRRCGSAEEFQRKHKEELEGFHELRCLEDEVEMGLRKRGVKSQAFGLEEELRIDQAALR